MNERFEVGARLGHGDMGIVYEAWDHAASRAVAIKVYRHDDDVTVARVRRIFERLHGLRHRNVVELLELLDGPEGPVLVMERVDGEDMMSYCAGRWRSEPPGEQGSRPVRCDLSRLRSCLVQLVSGLIELHRRDVVHRDLKPSNLRVTPEGRLVILDFSLSDDRSSAGQVGGTVPYMAPEQAMIDASIGPGADWYAVGAITYEALTGRPPFVGAPQRVLQDKAAREPVGVERLVSDAPRDLIELCRRLLVPDPVRRPADAELQTLVGLAASRPSGPVASPPPPRQARAAGHVMERLRAAVDGGHAGLVTLSGEHGLGRTATLASIAGQLLATWPDAVVLSLRAQTSFAGDFLDDLGGQLAAAWASMPDPEQQVLVPAKIGALVALLPALERVPVIADRPDDRGHRAGHAALTDALEALRELLTLMSRRRPVALLIDDLDELDDDGARILADGLRGPDPPPVLVVGTCASEARLPPIERLVPVPLEWWSRLEIERLIADPPMPAVIVRGILERSEGNPAVAVELARSHRLGEIPADGGVVEIHAARVARLMPASRQILVGAALVPGGVPAALLARALDLDGATFDALTAPLEAAGLTTVRGRDRVIAPATRAVVAALGELADDPAFRPLVHAVALHGDELPAVVRARLWRLVGDDGRAGAASADAGARASERLRFAAATDAYAMAVACGRVDLQLARAEAAAAAGRGREAARALAEAARGAEGADQLRLAVRAAEHHILAGELDAGMDAYRHALGLAGFPLAATPGSALPRLLARRGWLRLRGVRFASRPRGDVPPFDLARADACFSAGYHLSVLETVIGAELQSRALAFALRLGEPERLGFAAVLESVYLTTQGSVPRAGRLIAMAKDQAARLGSGRLAAFADLGGAAQLFFHHNRFDAAVVVLDAVTASSDPEGWTVDLAQTYACMSLAYLGDIPGLTRRVLRLIREAERRGDRYAAMVLRVRTNLAWLARGDADGADDAMATAERSWPFDATRFRVPDFYRMYGRAERALWAGDAITAARVVAAGLPPLERSMLTRVHHVRADTDFLAGRAAVAAADVGAARAAARAWLRRLRRNPVGMAPTYAALLGGCAAAHDGDHAAAVAGFTDAIAHADGLALGLHAAAGRVRLGELIGGTDGAAILDRGFHELARLGVTDTARTVQLFAPR